MLLNRLLTSRGGSLRAATPENPSFDLNSPDAWDALGAQRASTGQPVSAESALTWDAWYRGVTLLALYIAKTPLHVYRKVHRSTGDGRQIADDHPAFKLLRWKANETQTAFQLQLALAGHAINRGNGYAYIWRTGGGEPRELTILDPDKTEPAQDPSGRWWYVTEIGTEKRKIPPEDVLHFRGFGFDGRVGYPAYRMAKDYIGLGDAAVTFKAVRFRNQARPSVVLETEKKVDSKARQELRQDWERMHTGVQNAHRTAILDNGLKVSKLAFTAEEMQEVEQAGLTIRAAANFLGVPSSKLGDTEGVKYASKEQDDQAFLDEGLDFWFCTIEDESRDKLLTEKEKDGGDYSVEFDRTKIAQGDRTSRANYFRTATGGRGWMAPNEVRHELGMEPSSDPDADKILTPLNMGQGGPDNKPGRPADPGKTTADDPPRPDPGAKIDHAAVRAAGAAALADATRRMVRRIGTHAVRAAKEPARYLEWVRGFEAEHAAVAREALGPAERITAAVSADARPKPGEAADYMLSVLRLEFDRAADEATPRQLASAVEQLVAEQEQRVPADVVSIFYEGETP